jgi:hypothetical protein
MVQEGNQPPTNWQPDEPNERIDGWPAADTACPLWFGIGILMSGDADKPRARNESLFF